MIKKIRAKKQNLFIILQSKHYGEFLQKQVVKITQLRSDITTTYFFHLNIYTRIFFYFDEINVFCSIFDDY